MLKSSPTSCIFPNGNISLNKDLQLCMFWCLSWRLKIFEVTFHFECTFIKKRGRLFHFYTGTQAKNVTFLLEIRQLWHSQTTHPHSQKWTIDLLFKNNRNCKQVEWLEASKVNLFISFCNMLFWFVPQNKIYMVLKKYIWFDWGNVL